MGIPEGTVKSRLRLAMAKLESVLDLHITGDAGRAVGVLAAASTLALD